MSSVRTLIGQSSNVACAADNLNYTIASQITIPANSITSSNDFIDVNAWGLCTLNSDTKNLLLDVGGGQVMSVTFPVSKGDWHLQARFYLSYTTQNPQRCWGKVMQDGGLIEVQTATPTVYWGQDNDMLIQIRGNGGIAAEIQCNKVEVYSETN